MYMWMSGRRSATFALVSTVFLISLVMVLIRRATRILRCLLTPLQSKVAKQRYRQKYPQMFPRRRGLRPAWRRR